MEIRFAEPHDVGRLGELLHQVHDVHSTGRPDIFRKGNRKYNDGELLEILKKRAHARVRRNRRRGVRDGLRLLRA